MKPLASAFSSCANYIFPVGQNKSITSLRLVGWHGNMQHLLHLHRSGKAPMGSAMLEEVTALATQDTEFYKTIGVDVCHLVWKTCAVRRARHVLSGST